MRFTQTQKIKVLRKMETKGKSQESGALFYMVMVLVLNNLTKPFVGRFEK